ncbi:MAG: (E)-4-hydroxy-3-methylbut-2-enyl-diphosphate synthase [Akkermansia sp.]|nr:(E)-4-hydroxy-3-methylbut-2-enyl-diphosphate synthase [Akkermansia sp.]
MSMLLHCPSLYRYTRRLTREVQVGNLGLGGENPIRIQSMLTSATLDTEACVKEALALAEAGCEIIRLTAQTKVHAANLEHIARELRAAGCQVPLVADIHFKPDAAMEAAKWVEKIRVNPGNFIDKKKFVERDYTDSEYEEELERVRKAFTPLVLFCKEHGRAMRLGANHGSLSDRILNRYGDTPEGMVESALEFARVARELDYHQLVFSMKSSNVKVMIQAYRLLAKRLAEEGADWNYPIHLGVTEAGEGEDARIKSATGIGSLLADGIGDTLRVSLTEDPVYEIKPGFELAAPYQPGAEHPVTDFPDGEPEAPFNPFSFGKRKAELIEVNGVSLGWNEPVRVVLPAAACEALSPSEMKDFMPELAYEACGAVEVDPRDAAQLAALEEAPATLVTVKDGVDMPVPQAFRLLAALIPSRHSILLKDTLGGDEPLSAPMAGGLNIGSLLCDGIGNAVLIRRESDPRKAAYLGFNVLQASGVRLSKTEYVSCPSCGRTLYNIQEASARIRQATGHLKGVKIAIMGCIVNGPGEMSDADFGYVGGAPNKINLYVGHTPVEFNIPQEEAVERLIELIRSHGRWVEPS